MRAVIALPEGWSEATAGGDRRRDAGSTSATPRWPRTGRHRPGCTRPFPSPHPSGGRKRKRSMLPRGTGRTAQTASSPGCPARNSALSARSRPCTDPGDQQPAVARRETPDHALGRGLLVADVRNLRRPRATEKPIRSGLLPVRESGPADQLGQSQAGRARATNSIRGGANQRALQALINTRSKAWSDDRWVIDASAVRVSLVCFSRAGDESASDAHADGHSPSMRSTQM